ncbi:gamma-secretase subunit PEN-2-like [Daphnia carinata]|uniref:gamma-secretase subunit PEN-2-like n=1 Tax=Daphnia carinata TaxID=120202 RepID=UPI00257F3F15|nr:gamma-secretase subunit PEN-2-like [Daphnia carinata]
MDIERLKNEAKLVLCRKYYYAGFAFLPFLWTINAVWFFREAFHKPEFDEQPQIKQYVVRSGIGAFLWMMIFIGWTCVFQSNRATWGELGDQLSFVIPRGIP